VADAPLPARVRIVRPYDSEEAFLDGEFETIGKKSVVLVGAPAQPPGTILRFEIVLANGVALVRGEGRVLSHANCAFRNQPGLTLRLTRLDLRSKALVDRASAMRSSRSAAIAAHQPDREELLERLRKRASNLDANRIGAILGARKRERTTV
jgi:hypothetical protein